MNLSSILEAAGHVREIARLAQDGPAVPAWITDEEAFFRHFGATVEEFEAVVEHLSPGQTDLLRRTLVVNPEAAVIWILSMEELA